MSNRVIIFDLDGTICNVKHRRKFVANYPKNWDAWNKGISLDTPNEAVKFMFESIVSRDDVEVLFVSGRSDEYREVTETWLEDNGFAGRLYMRKEGDFRDDGIVKGEIADKIISEGNEIFCVFDDRKRVVDMWIERGIFVFDVANGGGDF